MELKELEIGQKIPPFKVRISKEIYFKYNQLVNEINPLHFDKKYANNLGYDNAVVAGIFLYSYIPKWLIEWISYVELIDKITIRFENPVYIDDTILLQGSVRRIREENNKTIVECDYQIEKKNGQKVTSGTVDLSSIS